MSTKEAVSVFITYDYVSESMSNPGPEYKQKMALMEPKFSPELGLEPVVHEGKDFKYQFNDFVDEAVAQAMNACEELGNGTELEVWFVQRLTKRYYLSKLLELLKHDRKVILAALDSWIWDTPEISEMNEVWKYVIDEDS